MGTVNARDLSRRTASILDEVAASGRPWLVLRRGQPVAALVAIDPDELEDWVLANAPAFVRSMRQADADLRLRRRVGDPKVSRLVLAFLKSGILSEQQIKDLYCRNKTALFPPRGLDRFVPKVARGAADLSNWREWRPFTAPRFFRFAAAVT